MNKERLRKLEFPILLGYLGLWLLVYLLSRIFLEMYTDDTPSQAWVWLLIVFVPLSGYAALRMAFSEGGKWYHSIGYFLIFTIGSVFTGQYILVNGDILLSALSNATVQTQAKVIRVEKVFRRKTGFDHTDVVLQFNGKKITLEARPYSFFYLQHKSVLQITAGTSLLGNTYVSSSGVASQEKDSARWLHLKDWAYRSRLLWGIIIAMILGIIIKAKFFPEQPGVKRQPVGFWKLFGMIMGILIAISLVLYAGLFIYVKFFASR